MFSGKKVYDITRTVQSGMTVWPGDSETILKRTVSMSEGSIVNITDISMSAHAGTHMDAPLHFFENAGDISSIPLDKLYGRALVVEAAGQVIDESHLRDLNPNEVNAVFFKTLYSLRDEMSDFSDSFPGLTLKCAKTLFEKGITAAGVDYLSVDPYMSEEWQVHRYLLSHNVVIIENLCLAGIEPGAYDFICLPLKLKGSEGAPCRALLFK